MGTMSVYETRQESGVLSRVMLSLIRAFAVPRFIYSIEVYSIFVYNSLLSLQLWEQLRDNEIERNSNIRTPTSGPLFNIVLGRTCWVV